MQFTLSNAGTHVAALLSGAPTESDGLALLKSLLQASRESGLERALVEVRVAYGLDPVSTKSLVVALPALGFPKSYRIAVLLLDEAARESASFAEDVAVNRGIGVRVFSGRDEALAWLLA